jgi:hypothetical protein
MWQDNHAILHGPTTVFYNKKYVLTSKTKATTAAPIRFYYVMGAGKPAPTDPSNQGFYQSLWDDLDRSNHSLKQTAPSQANKASARRTEPPTQKSKASSAAVTSPLTFNALLSMLLAAWKTIYRATIKFPIKLVAFFPADTVLSVAGINITDSTSIQS